MIHPAYPSEIVKTVMKYDVHHSSADNLENKNDYYPGNDTGIHIHIFV